MLRPTGTVARVAEALIARIVSGEYAPGLRLPAEVDIADEFSCGRSTVREALRFLGALNLVQSRRGSGAVVLDFRREGSMALLVDYLRVGKFEHSLPVLVAEMLQMRKVLACETVRIAAMYADKEALRPVRKRIEQTHAQRDKPLEHSLGELEVFRGLTHASRLWPAAWLANAFVGPMRDVLREVAGSLHVVPDDWFEVYTQLMELIEAGKAEEAVAHLGAHFDRVDGQVADGLRGIFGG